MKTAVEWLIEKLTPSIALQQKYMNEFKEKAKEMEKEQIIDAYEKAMETDIYNTPLKVGKDYYNETFNK